MSVSPSLVAALLLVLAGSAIQVAVGAGLSVVCGAFMLLWLGPKTGVPVLLGLNLLVSVVATVVDARAVLWRDALFAAVATLAGCFVASRIPGLSDAALKLITAIVLLVVAIGLNLYLPMLYSPQRRATRVPAGVPIVLGWAGMRGVVTLTAALALPLDFPGRDTILFASFVVILFTVLVQGTTLAPLILGLKLTRAGPSEGALMNLNETRIAVTEAGLVSLQSILVAESGEVMHPRLIDMYQRKIRAMSRLRDEGFAAIESERSDHFTAALGALATSRQTLLKLHRERKIHDSVLRTIEGELDLEELRLMRAAEK